jgi:hypothetical protein
MKVQPVKVEYTCTLSQEELNLLSDLLGRCAWDVKGEDDMAYQMFDEISEHRTLARKYDFKMDTSAILIMKV